MGANYWSVYQMPCSVLLGKGRIGGHAIHRDYHREPSDCGRRCRMEDRTVGGGADNDHRRNSFVS
jgi:hypothetical protein